MTMLTLHQRWAVEKQRSGQQTPQQTHDKTLQMMACTADRRVVVGVLVLLSVATSLRTLTLEEELRNTGFGCPPPRHGLRLLEWYGKKCLDNNNVSLCDARAGAFGFHEFKNKEHLLPKLNTKMYTYYTVGNLNARHAEDLPPEVRRYYNHSRPLSNMDRVLVKLNNNNNYIQEIYVSAHYKKRETYVIGHKLLGVVRKVPALKCKKV